MPLRLRPDRSGLARAAELLRAGRLVAFPTETVYGLGARADDDDAVGRIFSAKGRVPENPLIVHVDSLEAARRVARVPAWAEGLAQAFWPGPLTLVCPLVPGSVSRLVTARGDTVGVRVPGHAVALELARLVGLPIAAPSANRSLGVSPTSAEHVEASLGERVDAIVDGGPCEVGLESTVLDVTREPARVLRPGGLSREVLSRFLGFEVPLASASAPQAQGEPRPALRSPGQLERHYAPRVGLELADEGAPASPSPVPRERTARISLEGERDAGDAAVVVHLAREPGRYARELYRALHWLDGLDGLEGPGGPDGVGGEGLEGRALRERPRELERIVVSRPPAEPAWEAIHDRLRRASARGP